MRTLVTAALLLSAACGSTRTPSPLTGTTEDDPLVICMANCGGCCDVTGRCLTGRTPDACGFGGDLCTTCSAGSTCSIGICRAPSTSSTTPTTPSTPPSPGEVSLRWRFSGQACAVVREVTTVTIDIPGLVLPNQGVFRCSTGAIDGAELLAVQPDLYRYTARGLAADGRLLYEASGSFSVNGPVLKRIDFTPAVGATGSLTIGFRLPSRPGVATTCAALGITSITATTSSRSPVTIPCEGATLSLARLPAGTRNVSLIATDANGLTIASAQGSAEVLAGADTFAELPLSWTIGSLPIQWTLTNQSLTQTCQGAGVSDLYVNLSDEAGRFLYPGAGVVVPCADGATAFPTLPAGRYTVFGQAVGPGGALYRSQGVAGTVRAASFPTATSTSAVRLIVAL